MLVYKFTTKASVCVYHVDDQNLSSDTYLLNFRFLSMAATGCRVFLKHKYRGIIISSTLQ